MGRLRQLASLFGLWCLLLLQWNRVLCTELHAAHPSLRCARLLDHVQLCRQSLSMLRLAEQQPLYLPSRDRLLLAAIDPVLKWMGLIIIMTQSN